MTLAHAAGALLFDGLGDRAHPEGQVKAYCGCWTVHHACPTVPALLGVGYIRFTVALSEYVTWACLDTLEARCTFFVEYWWYLGFLLRWILDNYGRLPKLRLTVHLPT